MVRGTFSYHPTPKAAQLRAMDLSCGESVSEYPAFQLCRMLLKKPVSLLEYESESSMTREREEIRKEADMNNRKY